MKKSIKVAILFIILTWIICSSFSKEKSHTHAPDTIANNEELQKVQEFVRKNVCSVLYASLQGSDIEPHVKHFSRCPSGYNPTITTKIDLVKSDRFVNGRILSFKGCSSNYLCDFKVCVAKNFVMLRSKGTTEYLSVREWVKRENEESVFANR